MVLALERDSLGVKPIFVFFFSDKEDKENSLIIKTNVARCDSTESERAFQKHYTTITHRMIHRKASLEMYKRVTQRSLGE